jgi:hypothetical protein
MEAELFSERAAAIHNLELLAHSVLFGDRGFATMEKLAQLCEQLGETRLSQAWWKAADLCRPKSEKSAGALSGTQQRRPNKQSMAAAGTWNCRSVSSRQSEHSIVSADWNFVCVRNLF